MEIIESVGAAAFAAVGLAGLVIGGAFLVNFLPVGTFNDLISGGTVPVLNGAVGLAVAAAIVLLLSGFLEQAVVLRRSPEPRAGSSIVARSKEHR
jgi:multicomponent Na+:H+ antiporter subunit B